MLRIKLVKSKSGNTPTNRRTVAGLGLNKTGSVVYHNDTPSIRGMIHHVKHLLEVTEVDSAPERTKGDMQRRHRELKAKAARVAAATGKKPSKKGATPPPPPPNDPQDSGLSNSGTMPKPPVPAPEDSGDDKPKAAKKPAAKKEKD
jgi:large subunit ribosomal protein L30